MNSDLTIRQVLAEHFKRYTTAYFKAAGYFLLASLGAFTDLFGELTWTKSAMLAWWQILALIVKCLIPGIAAVMAFLNTSVAKITLEKKEDDAKGDPTHPPPKTIPQSATL